LSIPANFVTAHLPAGKRLAWMGGIVASATSGNDYGPGLIAWDPSTLAANPCASRMDYTLGRGTTLAEDAGNANGPTAPDRKHISGSRLGCRPSPTSLTPRPAYLSLLSSFYDLYNTDWDPYDGHSYYGDDTAWREDMYDDTVKSAMVVGMTTTIGYLKTTVV